MPEVQMASVAGTSPEDYIRTTFDVLKLGLGPYILRTYRREFGANFLAEMRDVTRDFKKLDFGDDVALCREMDTQGWLDLVLRRKQVFERDLGRLGLGYVSELLVQRNKLAHEEEVTMLDAARTTDTSARLLQVVGETGLAENLSVTALRTFNQVLASMPVDQIEFSAQVQLQMRTLDKTIAQLTSDQYAIIQWLRGQKRAAIAGCAGSGKTLVAVEKAVRLAEAGLLPLILCHNPHLAAFIRHLVRGANIEVYDFAEWVQKLCGIENANGDAWSHFVEPTDAELDAAFSRLAEMHPKYDAVIVDEGQDFRDLWWLLVEEALVSPHQGILYVFYDDNQALLPLRSKHPIQDAPFVLSKNCRNAGAVFDVVRRFHIQAPEPSAFLAKQGEFACKVVGSDSAYEAAYLAIRDALSSVSPEQLVVLTTEPEPSGGSVLNNLIIRSSVEWEWQSVVSSYLTMEGWAFRNWHDASARLPRELLIPGLSNDPFPTAEDIKTVSAFARRILAGADPANRTIRDFRLVARHVRWNLWGPVPVLSTWSGLPPRLSAAAFFQFDSWADELPSPGHDLANCAVMSETSRQDLPRIALYSVSEYKGLEADAVVLFVPAPRDDLERNIYVGASRARYWLTVVIDARSYQRISHFLVGDD